MKRWKKNSIVFSSFLCFLGSLFAFSPNYSQVSLNLTASSLSELAIELLQQDNTTSSNPVDTTLLFPVAPVSPEKYSDLENQYPIDLRTPVELQGEFEYNPATNRYELKTKVGDELVGTPISLTPEEYLEYTFKKSMNSYFKNRVTEEIQAETGGSASQDALSMFDFNFDLGPAEKLFGPGGVRLQAQGNALIKAGMSRTTNGNPTLSERQRNRNSFDFDTQIQTSITASVGDKISFDLNYNTESTFDFDNKKLKLGYVGKEDEIIKVLEAGNVSMNTSNSLIRGGAALFGIRTELQFGKLKVGAIFSQQESEARTVTAKGNSQTTSYEIEVDAFDENMHYFLDPYFYENYDDFLTILPYIKSGITINKIEVWVTNKRSNYDEARNIVAFADLGISDDNYIENPLQVTVTGSEGMPYNRVNTLYQDLNTLYTGARDKDLVNQTLGSVFTLGKDYEKIEQARRLTTNEYTLNSQLGYISLQSKLQSDEVLAVAYEYTTSNGQTYKVGEFSTDNSDNTTQNLYLKLIKGTSSSPTYKNWKLMMRNVYSISNRSIEKNKFRLDVKYQNDTTGVYMNYITEGDIANDPLIKVMNADRLDTSERAFPDGFFDYVEGYTALSSKGKIIFPVTEPFGKHLRKKINNDPIADKYVYEALYDTTLTAARQLAELNKFILTGEYKGSGSSNIELDAYNVTRGSVTVTANGVRLTENIDYTVNYSTGGVTIINDAYANAEIQVHSESQSMLSMQRKTMMGLNLEYAINPQFNVGATIMNLKEMPMTLKTQPGQEAVNNTLFGFNLNYSAQSYWLTHILDKIPLLDLTAPSQISLTAEYAQLIPGHYSSDNGGDYSYIDDFEQAKMTYDLRTPYSWSLSATPAMFPESINTNDIKYGNNRALLAWYTIDPLFTRRSSLTPNHIKNDLDQLSNHYVREVLETELYPSKQTNFDESSYISILNLAYYPEERGPYNLDVDGMNSDGKLADPEKRWGGMFRKIDDSQTNFESNNIEHIEFWLLDPFIYDPNSTGGDLYINLGDISEDILKDEKKFYENGIPPDGDLSKVTETVWGYVPNQQSLVYAFDADEKARRKQDVGLNGLSTEQELEFGTYKNYLNRLNAKLDPSVKAKWAEDPFSPLNDPAGDNYHYFRGSDYDRNQVSILERYKRYNGTEGNSPSTDSSSESYSTAARQNPDVEDINQDNTLNESEKYFQYKIHLDPKELANGTSRFVVDKREATVTLKNKNQEKVTWYQFKIPITDYEKPSVGDISDFSSIRFARMFLTDFKDPVVLRFATLQLVRGDWRTYEQDLSNPDFPPSGTGSISVSTVNLEENGDKEPVNYVMPPGVNRMIDPGQPQLTQQNEQSLSMVISNLEAKDSRAIYKKSGLDTRQYRRLQMFVHAEKLATDFSDLRDDDLSIFLRLGSDYKNNYYEYEIPLKITPAGSYSDNSSTDREIVWPDANKFDFPLELLTDVKLNRNKEKRKDNSTVNFYTEYFEMDPKKPMNKVTVLGNPTLSEVKVIMVGVRNNTGQTRSVEVWVNELSLTDFNEDGGWAGNVNLYLGLSDLGSVNVAAKKETAGFGGLDAGVMDRSLEDQESINIATQVELGKFFPEKAKVSLPLYYSYSQEIITPKYSPYDQDVLLKDALDALDNNHQRDSLKRISRDKKTATNFNLNNMRVDITSKNPMPYDPANFSFSYSHAVTNIENATTIYERETETRLLFNYQYLPMLKPWYPFANIGSKSDSKQDSSSPKTRSSASNRQSSTKKGFFREIGIGLLPKSISLSSDIYRNYYELQLRNVHEGMTTKLDPSWNEEFYWDRKLNIEWDLTTNLRLSLQTGTEARIDAPHVQVNKKYAMDEYELWKDGVKKSIQNWGTPMNYSQRFSANYSIPFKTIPILNFINAGLSFSSTYDWERGAELEDAALELGNTIKNTRTWGIDNVNINMVNLYSKVPFLDKTNKKYSLKTGSQNRQQVNRNRDKEKEKKPETKKFETKVTLVPDSAIQVKHNLNNKRIRLMAKDEKGKRYEMKFKKKDANTIEIKSKDSVNLELTITQKPPQDDEWWYKTAQVAARGLMSVRTVGFSYNETFQMAIPGFNQEIGDFFGQGSSDFGKTPGLDFAFGFVDESYIDKAYDNGWLITGSDNINPAITSNIETFTFSSLLEPIPGLEITLNGAWNKSDSRQYYYMYDNPTQQFNGNFSMTTIALKTMFDSGNSSNGYHSKAFDKFLANRDVILQRVQQQYMGMNYPAGMGSTYTGQYNPALTPVSQNSVDVLIPAFLAAYTGKDAKKANLDLFPSLLKLLPNWKISYKGFIQLPFINKYFKSFVLDHEYKCRYAVGSFNSHTSWMNGGDGLRGFIYNDASDTYSAASAYDIQAVSITESLDPLFKITSTFLNNTSVNFGYKVIRNINLNVTSYQIVEYSETGWTIGAGYRFDDFNKVIGMKKTGGKNFNNEFKVNADFTFSKTQSLIRKIEDGSTQATQGNSQSTIKVTADYSLSQMVTLQLYYDRKSSNPLVSATAYPTTQSDFGVSLRISFTR